MIKTGTIKTVSEGNKTLEHNRSMDAMGLYRDMFNLIITHDKGIKVNIPILPFPKIKNFTRETPIAYINITDYSDEEMLEVLRAQK